MQWSEQQAPNLCRVCGAYWLCEHREPIVMTSTIEGPAVSEFVRLDTEARERRKAEPMRDIIVRPCFRCHDWAVVVDGLCDACHERAKQTLMERVASKARGDRAFDVPIDPPAPSLLGELRYIWNAITDPDAPDPWKESK